MDENKQEVSPNIAIVTGTFWNPSLIDEGVVSSDKSSKQKMKDIYIEYIFSESIRMGLVQI